MSFSQITRENLPRYPYVRPTVPDFNALGMHVPWIIDGSLVINDRLRPDRYVITGITGLSGPDIRDSRMVKPADHGEVAYDAYWGGRTITVSGTIEAGSMPQMQRMIRDLGGALTSLEERPFKLNWWDQQDTFFDPYTQNFWSSVGGSFTVGGNGRASFSSSSLAMAYWNTRPNFGDCLVTACVSVIDPPSGNEAIGVFAKGTDTSHAIFAGIVYQNPGWKLVCTAQSGSYSQDIPISGGGTIDDFVGQATWWIRLGVQGNRVWANVYAQDPDIDISAPDGSEAPGFETPTELQGYLAQNLGEGTSGFAGLYSKSNSTCQVLEWRTEGLYPSDFSFDARPVQAPSIAWQAQQRLDKYTVPFQFAIRASDPRIRSATKSRSPLLYPSTSQTYSWGRVYPHTFEQRYQVLITSTGQLATQVAEGKVIVVCNNRGNWISYPVITLYGYMVNPLIVNNANGQLLQLDGQVSAGDYIVVDCAKKTIKSSSGASLFSMYDPGNSGWMQLMPGDNEMQLICKSFDSSASMDVMWNHSWGI